MASPRRAFLGSGRFAKGQSADCKAGRRPLTSSNLGYCRGLGRPGRSLYPLQRDLSFKRPSDPPLRHDSPVTFSLSPVKFVGDTARWVADRQVIRLRISAVCGMGSLGTTYSMRLEAKTASVLHRQLLHQVIWGNRWVCINGYACMERLLHCVS
jgi:hypothetical protein